MATPHAVAGGAGNDRLDRKAPEWNGPRHPQTVKTMDRETLRAWDRDHVWHPCPPLADGTGGAPGHERGEGVTSYEWKEDAIPWTG